MAVTYESDDRSVVEFQLGNKQLFLLFMGLLVICAIFFFIGLRVGEDTMRGKSAVLMAAIDDIGDSNVSAASTSEQMLRVNPPTNRVNNQSGNAKASPVNRPVNRNVRGTAGAGKTKNVNKPVTPTPVNKTSAATNNRPTQAGSATRGGWFVQVAAPQDSKSAEQLRTRLALNQPTIVQKANVKGKAFFRVRLGPFSSKTEAENVRNSVLSSFKEAFLVKN